MKRSLLFSLCIALFLLIVAVSAAIPIGEGPVELSPDEYVNITPVNSTESYRVPQATVLGALDEASILGDFEYEVAADLTPEEGNLSIVSIMGIDNEVLNGTPYAWDYWVNDERGTTGPAVTNVTDGDNLTYTYGPPNHPVDNASYTLNVSVSVPGAVVTPTPTVNVTPTPTVNVTPTPTVNVTPTPTVNVTPTPTVNVTPTPTENVTPTPTVTPGVPAKSMKLELYKGWNFVSIPRPLSPGNNTAIEVFRDVETGGRPIYTYTPENGFEPLGADTTLKVLDGYWVYSTEAMTVQLNFSTNPVMVPASKMLSPGWNAIGYSDLTPRSANESLISVEDSWVSVVGYDAKNQNYQPALINGQTGAHGENQKLLPTEGYWLFMREDGTLAAISA